jgi:predicted N-acetyltransferase YhbS
MLVNLLNLPSLDEALADATSRGAVIRRAQPFEITALRRFIETNFGVTWADEVLVGFSNKPVTVFIATRDRRVIGFGAYECTRKAFFGPAGVAEAERGQGIGRALLVACMHGLREAGYVYGIIGGAGPTDFYARAVGAVPIEGSSPGIYTDLLRKD